MGSGAAACSLGIATARGEPLKAKRKPNFMVIFTSDNGGTGGHSNNPLRGRKGSPWEGGLRVPTLAWQPGTVPANGACDEMVTAMDLLPTFALEN